MMVEAILTEQPNRRYVLRRPTREEALRVIHLAEREASGRRPRSLRVPLGARGGIGWTMLDGVEIHESKDLPLSTAEAVWHD